MQLLKEELKNNVLASMINIVDQRRKEIIEANKTDLANFNKDNQALYERLVVDNNKVDDMLRAIKEVKNQPDPVGKIISNNTLNTGLKITNKTAPFGTIMIIYESRPDVTIEAAVLAFKANNKILLKGGREAYHSNKILVECWHKALQDNFLSENWITMLTLNREQTQAFLKKPTERLDLIVPRGGEKLIEFVKKHAKCPVLVSGRGNNFLYLSPKGDWEKAKKIILNAKTHKISACNALDKVLFDEHTHQLSQKIKELVTIMENQDIQVVCDDKIGVLVPTLSQVKEAVWYEEFLSRKIMLGITPSLTKAIAKINEYSGHHSSIIISEDKKEAMEFMEQVDSAAVYQNASSRFTDGGAMGVGAELAISTDKLHHRGPLGLKQLVSNKYYIIGNGHIRK